MANYDIYPWFYFFVIMLNNDDQPQTVSIITTSMNMQWVGYKGKNTHNIKIKFCLSMF